MDLPLGSEADGWTVAVDGLYSLWWTVAVALCGGAVVLVVVRGVFSDEQITGPPFLSLSFSVDFSPMIRSLNPRLLPWAGN